ncbi:hypothetical protein, partial [Bacteroides sp.]|uniref:hypothetical protein n=1 Tax=Bacteroides sp. TaxID=29523 RepID=UPI003A0FDD96
PGNGKLMYTINFCTHGELALQGLYCVADTLICNTLYNQRKSLDSFMQSYGIIGVTLWRNGGVSTWKL